MAVTAFGDFKCMDFGLDARLAKSLKLQAYVLVSKTVILALTSFSPELLLKN